MHWAGYRHCTFGSGDLLEATEGRRSVPVASELPAAALSSVLLIALGSPAAADGLSQLHQSWQLSSL